MLRGFGGAYTSYAFLAERFEIFGAFYGLNRVVAFVAAVVIPSRSICFSTGPVTGPRYVRWRSTRTRASLVGIDVARAAALSFALGGALTACGGALLSTYYTFNASMGVVFTMKALIIVIMGGVGDVRGAVIAALILGITETAVARLIDPGLTLAATYALFTLVLLFRPQGIFGRQQA